MSEYKFSCPNCGQHLTATEAWSGTQTECPACHQRFTVPKPPMSSAAPAARSAALAAAGARSSAVGTIVPPQPIPPDEPATAPGKAAKSVAPFAAGGKTSGLAIASLVCGIFTFICGLGAIPAVICGHLALSRIKAGRAAGGRGMAIAGLIMGYLGILLTVVVVAFYGAVVLAVLKGNLGPK